MGSNPFRNRFLLSYSEADVVYIALSFVFIINGCNTPQKLNLLLQLSNYPRIK